MDKITNLKRKAQKLVQQGDYPAAIELYSDIVSSSDSDPYDFVVLGDLLLRDDQTGLAVDRYQEAVNSYIEGHLNRNAIALCKRIRRLKPERLSVQRQLGDLYLKEGLNSEAALHYLEYLESAKNEENFAEDAEATCSVLLGFKLPSYDLVPRIVDIAAQADRAEALAPLVFRQFQWASQEGKTKAAEMLFKQAQTLDPEIEANAANAAIDPGALELEPTRTPRAETPRDSNGEIGFDHDPSAVDLEAPSASQDNTVPRRHGDLELEEPHAAELHLVQDDAGADSSHESGVIDLDAALEPQDASGVIDLDAALAEEVQNEASEGAASQASGEELLERADRSLNRGEKVLAQREYLRAAYAFRDQGHQDRAETILAKIVELDPNHVEALESLVGLSEKEGDPEKWISYTSDLGDVYLARGLYDRALVQFEQILELDPGHEKALSRVKRLKAMNEDAQDEGEASAEDTGEVTIRDDAGHPTQTENDLAAILDEFRASIVDAIPDDDAQSHYDMGMAYKEMELLDEAIQEFQISMTNEDIRPQALEMTAECYLKQGQIEESLNLLDEVQAYAEDPVVQARIFLAMGKAHAQAQQFQEAQDALHKALELNEELMEAAEILQDLELRRTGN